MKKFTKIILIMATVLAVAGLSFVIAGSVTAGGMGTLTAQLRSGDLNFGGWHFDDGVYYNGDVKMDVTDMVEESLAVLPRGTDQLTNEFSEEITRLEINTDLADLTIKTSDVEKITVSLKEGYAKYYDVKVSGDTMYISYDVGGTNFKQGPKITVEIPQQMTLEAICVDTALGEVKVQDLELSSQELELNSDLGNIIVENCKVDGYCIASAALGNIKVDDCYFTSVDMSADMGNIEFAGKVEGDIIAQADMGNIEVALDGKEADYNIELSTDMGDVTYNGQKQSGMGGSITYYQENAIGEIRLNCDMGNVKLTFE